MDTAVAPVTARIANRVSRGVGQLADINVSPIMVVDPTEWVLPAEAVANLCVLRAGQNACSETRMISPSMDSMTWRSDVSFGSTFLAKNAAVATLP